MTMTDTDTQRLLTLQDVRALKHADSICFDHNPDGTGQIRAIQRGDTSPTGFEQTHVIPARTSRVNDFEGRWEYSYSGFHMEHSARYHAACVTLVRQLRAGTQFALQWTRDNRSPVTTGAGIVVDYLEIAVQVNAKRCDTFLVATYVGLNNSARMVKRIH